jgi:hypothetical protein
MAPVKITMKFIDAVEAARKESGLSWNEVHAKCGVAKNTISTWRTKLRNTDIHSASVQKVASLCAFWRLDPSAPATGIHESSRKAVADRVAQLNEEAAKSDATTMPKGYQVVNHPHVPDLRDAPPKGYRVVSQLQLLDLRGPPGEFAFPSADGKAQRVALLDQYHFMASEELLEFTFMHATTGDGIDGECISHPEHAVWENVPVEASVALPWAPGWRFRKRIRVRHPLLQEGKTCTVVARLVFVNAFTRPDMEFFSNGIEFPTGSLTQVLLFPEQKRCRTVQASAFRHFGAGDAQVQVPKPHLMDEGRMVLWHVAQPAQHYSYVIQWKW